MKVPFGWARVNFSTGGYSFEGQVEKPEGNGWVSLYLGDDWAEELAAEPTAEPTVEEKPPANIEVMLPEGDDRKASICFTDRKPDGTIQVYISVTPSPEYSSAEPAGYRYRCRGRGKFLEYFSCEPNDHLHWPEDDWREVKVDPLYDRPLENSKNQCVKSAIEALRYLATYPKPVGGQDEFNTEHLLQIASEVEDAIKGTYPTGFTRKPTKSV